jgi:hypothetical protein
MSFHVTNDNLKNEDKLEQDIAHMIDNLLEDDEKKEATEPFLNILPTLCVNEIAVFDNNPITIPKESRLCQTNKSNNKLGAFFPSEVPEKFPHNQPIFRRNTINNVVSLNETPQIINPLPVIVPNYSSKNSNPNLTYLNPLQNKNNLKLNNSPKGIEYNSTSSSSRYSNYLFFSVHSGDMPAKIRPRRHVDDKNCKISKFNY